MIAVDAMGGDYAPKVVLAGALKAAQSGIPLLLCGDIDQIEPILTSLCPTWRNLPIHCEPCTQVIEMAEEPSRAVLRKKDASLVRAAQAVKEGRASALVSAGNSGAVLVVSALQIGRVPGVLRPALGNMIPTPQGGIFCLDLGANTDCKSAYLAQFALFGSVYMQEAYAKPVPRVALLSNGHEPYKGSELVKETYALLEMQRDIHFVGNLEARDIFEGSADVLVMDGFAGNVLLKGIQGTVRALFSWIKQEATQSWWRRLSAVCARPLFSALRATTDYQKAGGAILLGVKKPVIVAHGNSQEEGIYHAIRRAHETVRTKLLERVNERLEKILSVRIAHASHAVASFKQ
jgi:glycerol-3-phosphate acyltransferase PlsX